MQIYYYDQPQIQTFLLETNYQPKNGFDWLTKKIKKLPTNNLPSNSSPNQKTTISQESFYPRWITNSSFDSSQYQIYEENLEIKSFKIINNNQQENLKVEIKRHLQDDFFSLKIDHKSANKYNRRISVQINNQNTYEIDNIPTNNGWETFYIPFLALKKTEFNKLESMSILIHENNNKNRTLTLKKAIQFKFEHFAKNQIQEITEQGLILRNPWKFNYDEQNPENIIVNYANILIKPYPFSQQKVNQNLFEIWSFYDDNLEKLSSKDLKINADFILNLPVENLAETQKNSKKNSTNDLGLKVRFTNKKIANLQHPQNLTEKNYNGLVEIIDPTFYLPETQNTYFGIGQNSQRGFILPLNFEGILTPITKVSFNNFFDEIFLNYTQEITTPVAGKINSLFQVQIEIDPNYKFDAKINKKLRKIHSSDFKKIVQKEVSLV